MARRKLTMKGRIVAAGLSIGVTGALAGYMAAGDRTADATQPASSTPTGSNRAPSSASSSSGASVPQDGGSRSTPNEVPQYTPQPQTRTGGS